MFTPDYGVNSHESSSEFCRRFIFEKELDAEILQYKVFKPEIIKAYKCSNLFWQEYSMEMPMLGDLYLLLMNIPQQVHTLNTFFSISGIVCDKRSNECDLIECRSMLKANMKQIKVLKYSCK